MNSENPFNKCIVTEEEAVAEMEAGRAAMGPATRLPDGRFAKGNQIRLGAVSNRRVKEFRTAIRNALTPDQLAELAIKMWEEAMRGNVAAGRELFDRYLGKAVQPVKSVSKVKVETPIDDETWKNIEQLRAAAAAKEMLDVVARVIEDEQTEEDSSTTQDDIDSSSRN